MKFLLDTHTLIWFMNGEDRISASAANVIRNKNNFCFVSIASVWEYIVSCFSSSDDITVFPDAEG